MASALLQTCIVPNSSVTLKTRSVKSAKQHLASGLPSLQHASRKSLASKLAVRGVNARASWSEDQQTSTDSVFSGMLGSSASKVTAILAAGALLLAPLTIATGTAEAAQGGGRVGGSSGFSRSRSAPPPRAAPSTSTTVVAPSVVVAPSPFGFSPFGYSPFAWSPFGFFTPTVVVGGPGFGFGFIFSTIIFLVVASVVISVITSVFRRD